MGWGFSPGGIMLQGILSGGGLCPGFLCMYSNVSSCPRTPKIVLCRRKNVLCAPTEKMSLPQKNVAGHVPVWGRGVGDGQRTYKYSTRFTINRSLVVAVIRPEGTVAGPSRVLRGQWTAQWGRRQRQYIRRWTSWRWRRSPSAASSASLIHRQPIHAHTHAQTTLTFIFLVDLGFWVRSFAPVWVV